MDIELPKPPIGTVEGLFAFRREHADLVTFLSIKWFVSSLELITEEECDEKFLRGRKQYGGPYIPANIKLFEELPQEVIDVKNYVANHVYGEFLEDPSVMDNYYSVMNG